MKKDCTTCRHAQESYHETRLCQYPLPSPVKQRVIRLFDGRAQYVTELGAKLPVHPCACWEERKWGVEAQEDDGWE